MFNSTYANRLTSSAQWIANRDVNYDELGTADYDMYPGSKAGHAKIFETTKRLPFFSQENSWKLSGC